MNRTLALLVLAVLLPKLQPAHADAPATQRPNAVARAGTRARDRADFRRFLRSIDATEAQRKVALEQARSAGPIARSARTEGRAIRVEALRKHPGDRRAARETARPRIRELRERTLSSLRPLAQEVLASLSPDQRKKLEDAARARGKELDEARLENVVSWLLTGPGTQAHPGKRTRR